MQLSRTRITIRERNLFELLDLSLRVIVAFWKPLLLAAAVGVTPWAVLISVVLERSVDFEFDEDAFFFYWLGLTGFVLLCIPIATAPLTVVLGKLMFLEPLKAKDVARQCLRAFPQILFIHIVLRALLMSCFYGAAFIWVSFPYLNEVILLERNPFFAGRSRRLTTWKRCRALHRYSSGTLLSRAIGSGAVAVALIAAWTLTINVIAMQIRPEWGDGAITRVNLVIAMWLAACFFTVVRFLGYLDLRIRREGWEVELAMRAEAERMHKSREVSRESA